MQWCQKTNFIVFFDKGTRAFSCFDIKQSNMKFELMSSERIIYFLCNNYTSVGEKLHFRKYFSVEKIVHKDVIVALSEEIYFLDFERETSPEKCWR